MNAVTALAKQLFGAKYERVGKSLLACLILFLTLYAAELKMPIAPSILYLTATAFSAGIMWPALNSTKNADSMMGLFPLPFDNRRLTYSIALTFSGYTLITKTFLVLALFFAVQKWNGLQIAVSILCACNGCMMAVSWYSMMRAKKWPLALLWGVAVILSIFLVRRLWIISLIVLTSLLLSVVHLSFVDAYVFYRPVFASPIAAHAGKTGSVFLYLLRYLMANTSYLLNTFGLFVVACFMPLLLGEFEGLNIMPLGFAILCLNTPICILLSCDPDLEQSLRTLPGQVRRFCSQYCLFIFCINMLVNSIYLLCWQVRNGGIGNTEVITSLLFAGQSAILSVLLEWLHPIRGWKVETDLWHHPRKYLVPAVMILIAGVIGIWPLGVWIWLCIILAECFGLLIVTRRI